MKTAVSLPDSLYRDAERTPKSMGIPRSQLYAKALEEFLCHHQREWITANLNAIYSDPAINDQPQIIDPGLEAIRELTKNDTW